MADSPKKFGRYFLLDLLAQGGMAEIYRARLASTDGAGRLIVIKRIQSGHGADKEFIQMFRSEIKVTMGFNHPNIVQLYDFGEESNQPYIAMEWVDGRNLRQFMARFLELKQKFPIDLATQIIEQAACGLNYAHNFKDKISGNPLNVVHRDISPQNLIISFEGSVKVIDFGIAKASVNSEATRAGVIKGKPSYLSPEQINGDVLDGRSDIFSLGTVLWELLAGRKLFSGDSDLAILKQIESCNTYVKPPSTLNPDVPPELDYIVLKSLAKQRDKRYQTAEELQRALHKFLYSHSPEFNPSDLAYYAKDLFKNEIVEDRKKIQKLNDEVERLLISVVPTPAITVDHSNNSGVSLEIQTTKKKDDSENESTMVATKAKPTFTVYEGDINDNNSPLDVVTDKASPMPKFRPSSVSSNGVIPIQPQMATVGADVSRKTRKQQGSKGTGGGLATFAAMIAIAVGGVIIFGKDFGINFGKSREDSASSLNRGIASPVDAPPPVEQVRDAQSPQQGQQAKPKTIQLKINLAPGGGSPVVKVNGQLVDPEKLTIAVPMDQLLELTVERKDYKPFSRQFFIESAKVGDLDQWLSDVELEPNEYGTLKISTTPSAVAKIMMDGKPWTINTPFKDEIKLPIGTYLIELTNAGLGMSKTIRVTITKHVKASTDDSGKISLEDVHLDDSTR